MHALLHKHLFFEVCACDREEYCCEILLASCKSIVIFLYFCVGHPVSDLMYLVRACQERRVLSPLVTVEGFRGGEGTACLAFHVCKSLMTGERDLRRAPHASCFAGD